MEFFVPPDEAAAVVRVLVPGAPGLVHAARHRPRAPAPAPARRRGALALLERRRATSSTCTRSAGRELEGVANRGDFDLTQHAEYSRREARVQGPADRRGLHPARDRAGRRPRPHGARAAVRRLRRGRDRRREAHRAAPASARRADQGRRAPAAAQGRPSREGARDLRSSCASGCRAEYDEGGNIGKRYRRQDEIGTPFAVTVDHQTLEDGTVTLRDRDSLSQERVPVEGSATSSTARVTNRT